MNGVGGSLAIVLTENLDQNNPKVTNGIFIDGDGGSFMIDQPPTDAFVNPCGSERLNWAPPSGATPPGGTTGGFVVTTSTPSLNLVNFVAAGVGTDSTRMVTQNSAWLTKLYLKKN